MRQAVVLLLLWCGIATGVCASPLEGEYAGQGAAPWSLELREDRLFSLSLPGAGPTPMKHTGAWFAEGERLFLVTEGETGGVRRATVWMLFAIEQPPDGTTVLRFLSPVPTLVKNQPGPGASGLEVTLADIRAGNVRVLEFENVLRKVTTPTPAP